MLATSPHMLSIKLQERSRSHTLSCVWARANKIKQNMDTRKIELAINVCVLVLLFIVPKYISITVLEFLGFYLLVSNVVQAAGSLNKQN